MACELGAFPPTPPPSPALTSRKDVLPKALQQLYALHMSKGINVIVSFLQQGELSQVIHDGVLHKTTAQELWQKQTITRKRKSEEILIVDNDDWAVEKPDLSNFTQTELFKPVKFSIEEHAPEIKPILNQDVNASNYGNFALTAVENDLMTENINTYQKQTSQSSAASEFDDSSVYSTEPHSESCSSTNWDEDTTFESLMAEWQSESNFGKKSWADMCEDDLEQMEAEVNVQTKSAKAKKRKGVFTSVKPRKTDDNFRESQKSESTYLIGTSRRKEDRDKKPRPQKQGRKLFVKNISYKVGQHQLWNFFATFGAVQHCQLLKDFKKRSRGMAYVTFEKLETAKKLLAMSPAELTLNDRELVVETAVWKKRDHSQSSRSSLGEEQTLSDVASSQSKSSKESLECASEEPLSDVFTLNHDIMLHILAFLNIKERITVERVCRRWRQLSLQSWDSMPEISLKGLTKGFSAIYDHNLRSLVKKGRQNIKQIDMAGAGRQLTDRSLEAIAHYCPDLVKLNMSGMNATNKGLRTLAQKCPQLQWISLQNCHEIGEDGLWWLFQRCKELKYVDIHGNRRIQGQCLHVLWDKLCYLNLHACSKLGDVGLGKIGMRCRHLQEINLSDCHRLSSAGFLPLIEGCGATLKILRLSGNVSCLTSEGLTHVGRLKQLEELYLDNNINVDDVVLAAVGAGCSKLRTIDLTSCHRGITDTGISCLSRCPLLACINISYLHKVTDSSLVALATAGELHKFIARGCGGISDDGLIAIVEQCCHLSSLDISGCFQISDSTMQALINVHTQGLATASDKMHLCIGGTSINKDQFNVPDNFEVTIMDLCLDYLRQDRDPVLYLGEDEDDEFGLHGQSMEEDYDEDVQWSASGVNVMAAEAFLDADDPLAAEEWEMS